MRVLLWCVMAVGCGDDGTATIDAGSGSNDAGRSECVGEAGDVSVIAAQNDTVLFHDEAGALLASVVVDGSRTATGSVPPCGQVTVAHASNGTSAEVLVTTTDVMPGDLLRFSEEPPPATTWFTASVTYPLFSAETKVFTPCLNVNIETQLVNPMAVTIPSYCHTGNDFNLIARISGGAFATFEDVPIAAPGTAIDLTVNSWRSDLAEIQVTATNRPATTWSLGASVAPVKDGLSYGEEYQYSPGGALTPFAVVPLGDTVAIWASTGIGDPDPRDVSVGNYISPRPTSHTIDFAARVPFVVTSIMSDRASRPSMTWTAADAPADSARVCASWVELAPHGTWCVVVNPARRSVQFPELPAGLWASTTPDAEGISVEDNTQYAGFAEARLTPVRTGIAGYVAPAGYAWARSSAGHRIVVYPW